MMRFAEYETPQGISSGSSARMAVCTAKIRVASRPARRGAIVQYANGIVDFHEENCIGCGYCVTGCPFNVPRLSKKDQGVQVHPVFRPCRRGTGAGLRQDLSHGAIEFGTKEEMKEHAQARIADLKSRGYANAGLYDPAGVGGTHVMYVLHHVDQPILQRAAEGSADQPGRVAVERGGQALEHGATALAALVGFSITYTARPRRGGRRAQRRS